jgi:hypothetical protein
MKQLQRSVVCPAAALAELVHILPAAAIFKPAARKAFVNGMKTADRESANNAPKNGRLITYALNASKLWI